MSLNDITLTPSLIADLYPDVLIEQSGQKRYAHPVNFLGRNEKNILIVCVEKNAVFLTEQQLAFLMAILDACKLGLADVAIVNWHNLEAEQKENLTSAISARSVILFGIDPSMFGLPVNFPQFQVQEFKKLTYIHAPSLDEIESNTGLKKQFWASLKRLFSI
jgi:hypothetical protein